MTHKKILAKLTRELDYLEKRKPKEYRKKEKELVRIERISNAEVRRLKA